MLTCLLVRGGEWLPLLAFGGVLFCFVFPFTYELFTLSIFTLLILPFILLGVEVSEWQGGGLAVGRGQTTTELLYLYLAVVQAIAISVQQRIFLYLFWKRNILKRNLEMTLSWQNLRTVLMYGAASKTSLRQVQESSAQRQREQEYDLPKLRTKKCWSENQQLWSRWREGYLEDQQHCHLFCALFLCICLKRPKYVPFWERLLTTRPWHAPFNKLSLNMEADLQRHCSTKTSLMFCVISTTN